MLRDIKIELHILFSYDEMNNDLFSQHAYIHLYSCYSGNNSNPRGPELWPYPETKDYPRTGRKLNTELPKQDQKEDPEGKNVHQAMDEIPRQRPRGEIMKEEFAM